jgi:hypothetical protein
MGKLVDKIDAANQLGSLAGDNDRNKKKDLNNGEDEDDEQQQQQHTSNNSSISLKERTKT